MEEKGGDREAMGGGERSSEEGGREVDLQLERRPKRELWSKEREHMYM